MAKTCIKECITLYLKILLWATAVAGRLHKERRLVVMLIKINYLNYTSRSILLTFPLG
jgi:hypothetical protein